MRVTDKIIDKHITVGRESTPLRQLCDQFDRRVQSFLGEPILYISENIAELVGAVTWFRETQNEGMVLYGSMGDQLAAHISNLGWVLVDGESGNIKKPTQNREQFPGTVSLLTSGTTGLPKVRSFSWDNLYTMENVSSLAPRKWVVTYRPGTYAWFQMVIMGLFQDGQDLYFSKRVNPEDIIQVAIDNLVTAISSTPTFWRYLLLRSSRESLASIPLKQITLGGEPVNQGILDLLGDLYPDARRTHIYATSETGSCIVVNDAREGFPIEWLGRGSESPIQLKIEGDELHVNSSNAASGFGDWYNTGDQVEIKDSRVVVVGRKGSEFVNIGGSKVYKSEIEKRLLSHSEIEWVRVYSRRSPLISDVLCADVVFSVGKTIDDAHLHRYCANSLSSEKIPRIWSVLEAVPMAPSMKAINE